MSHRGEPGLRPGPTRWRSRPLEGASRPGPPAPIAWLPTLQAKGRGALRREHLRHRARPAPPPRLHVIVLDASGSMRRGGRLAAAKGHAARLVEQAVRSGDDVALLRFGGAGIEWLMPPGPARRSGVARVRSVGGGGGTPLGAALAEVGRVMQRSHRDAERWLWLLTDGRTLEQPGEPAGVEHVVIVDFDPGGLGRCGAWAGRWGAEHRPASIPTTPAK